MAGEQKAFLKRLATVWRKDFPFLRPVHLKEVPQVPNGCNYLCDKYGQSRGCFYFVHIDFSAKRRGEFSIGITISPAPDRSIIEHSLVSKLTPTSIGMFTIWKFMNLPRFHWALVDLEAEQYALFAKLGVQQIDLRGLKSSNTWQPSSYDLPVDKIADEAIADVNDKLRRFVFPKLEVDFEN